ncbi:MAG: hypothetical protein J2P19_23815 [Pseudonocardia sp.]|nr:hypothetical protein [Pseudonocardia sp.]
MTTQPDRVRAPVTTEYAPLAALPSYRGALDRDGFTDGGGTVLAGTEEQVAPGLRRYAELGVTDALISLVGDTAEQARTLRLLGEITTGDRTPDTERT